MDWNDQFEYLVNTGGIAFHPATLGDLDPHSRWVVENSLLHPYPIKWSLGDKRVGNCICLKLEDEYLQYLDLNPDLRVSVWCTDHHHSGVHPDAALAYLYSKAGWVTHHMLDTASGRSVLTLTDPEGRTVVWDETRERNKMPME